MNQTNCNETKQEETDNLLVFLLTLNTDVNYLKDVVVGAEFQSSDIDLDIIFQEVLCQLADLFGPRGAPHQGLSVGLGQEKKGIITFLRKIHDGY